MGRYWGFMFILYCRESLAMVAEAIIRKTCNGFDIEVIDMSLSPDHIHLLCDKLQPCAYINNIILPMRHPFKVLIPITWLGSVGENSRHYSVACI